MSLTLDYGLIFTMCFLHFLALISPGPDFFLILRNALSFGRSVGLGTAFGFGTGILIHLSYGMAGVAVILVRMPWFPYLKFVAAFYLVWIGISSLLSLRKTNAPLNSKITQSQGTKTFFRGFIDGLVTNLFNPKAVLFLMGLFTTVITPTSDQYSILLAGAIIVALTILWFSLVAMIFGNEKIRKFYFKSERAMTALFAFFFIGVGILFCLK
ncbi:MAG: LysE family transporter [Bacteriovoracaceae bacterium]